MKHLFKTFGFLAVAIAIIFGTVHNADSQSNIRGNLTSFAGLGVPGMQCGPSMNVGSLYTDVSTNPATLYICGSGAWSQPAGSGGATLPTNALVFGTSSTTSVAATPINVANTVTDSQNNVWMNGVTSSTTTNWTYGVIIGKNAAPLWGTPGSTGITGQLGLICIGGLACNAMKTDNGSVIIGYGAAMNDPGGVNTSPGEDQNMVCIGPLSCENDDGSAFEVIAIGNKAYQLGKGENSTVIIGTHIYGPSGQIGTGGNVYLGGNITNSFGAGGTFVQGNHSTFVGADIFDPSTAPTASTTYSNSYETIVGGAAGTCFYNTTGNTIIGAQIGQQSTCSTIPTASENVFIAPGNYGAGNKFLQNITSGIANYIISGQGFGGSGPVGGNVSSGAGNVIVGGGAGSQVLALSGDTLVGNEAGALNVNITTAFGYQALSLSTSGAHNNAFGYQAGAGITTGSEDNFFGYTAGAKETTVANDNAFGYLALNRPSVTGGSNTCFGHAACWVNSGASGGETSSSAFGSLANFWGSNDLALGASAIVGAQSAGVNGAVQIGAGSNLTANTMQYQTFNFLTNTGIASFLHVIGVGTAPTLVAGAGAGTTPTVSVTNAHDLSGTINVTTGTTPTGSAVVATLTFGTAYGVAPNCSLTPASVTAALDVTQTYVTSTTTTLVINSGATGLTASTAHNWTYVCHQ